MQEEIDRLELSGDQRSHLEAELKNTEGVLLGVLSCLSKAIEEEKYCGKCVNWSIFIDSLFESDQFQEIMHRILDKDEERILKNALASANDIAYNCCQKK